MAAVISKSPLPENTYVNDVPTLPAKHPNIVENWCLMIISWGFHDVVCGYVTSIKHVTMFNSLNM